MAIDQKHFKNMLEEEKKLLLKNLEEVGVKNPTNPADWEGKPEDIGKELADPTDVADNIEEYESNSAVVVELETRLTNVDAALSKIDTGTYGTCTVCGKEIEEDRLNANPAAATCKEHINT